MNIKLKPYQIPFANTLLNIFIVLSILGLLIGLKLLYHGLGINVLLLSFIMLMLTPILHNLIFSPIKKTDFKFKSDIISDISSEGFRILLLNSLDSDKNSLFNFNWLEYKWSDIQDIQFEKDYESLIILNKNHESKIIGHETPNWYELIAKIPNQFPSFEKQIVKEIYSKFSACKICGTIAVYKGKCRFCNEKEWSESMNKTYKNELIYIKECQLEKAEIENKNPNFLLNDVFKINPSWKLVVNKKDIIKRRKQLKKYIELWKENSIKK